MQAADKVKKTHKQSIYCQNLQCFKGALGCVSPARGRVKCVRHTTCCWRRSLAPWSSCRRCLLAPCSNNQRPTRAASGRLGWTPTTTPPSHAPDDRSTHTHTAACRLGKLPGRCQTVRCQSGAKQLHEPTCVVTHLATSPSRLVCLLTIRSTHVISTLQLRSQIYTYRIDINLLRPSTRYCSTLLQRCRPARQLNRASVCVCVCVCGY